MSLARVALGGHGEDMKIVEQYLLLSSLAKVALKRLKDDIKIYLICISMTVKPIFKSALSMITKKHKVNQNYNSKKIYYNVTR